MKDEKDLEHDVNQGIEAQNVLNNPQYRKAFLMIKAAQMTAFEKSKFKDHEERDEVWRKLQSLNWLEKELKKVMETGKMSRKTLLDRVKNIARI